MAIKKFNELKDETYRRASSKLKQMGHPDRGNAIDSYIVNKNKVTNDVKDLYTIDNTVGYELYNSICRAHTFRGYHDVKNDDIDSISLENFKNSRGDIKFDLEFIFKFKRTREDKRQFTLQIGYRYNSQNRSVSVFVNIKPLSFNRSSAVKFKRTILKETLDKSILPELIMLLNIETEAYVRISSAIDNISVNAINSKSTNITIYNKGYTLPIKITDDLSIVDGKVFYNGRGIDISHDYLINLFQNGRFKNKKDLDEFFDKYSVSESLSPDTYKEWSKDFNWDNYKDLDGFFKTFKDSDRNHNRLYFDLKVNTDNFEVIIPDEIKDFFGWYGYPIIDYNAGICKDKDGRNIRIGRLLNRLGEDKLLATYNKSKENTLKNVDDLQVVISRHPYDIIGMSTDRGWTTCHDINDKRYGGKHLWVLQSFLKSGGLIAYLIRKSDRNINNPISRALIRCQRGSTTGTKYSIDHHVYGTRVTEFENFIKKWCNKLNNYKPALVSEELSPETYKDAASKLNKLGHTSRAMNINKWVEVSKDKERSNEYFYKIRNRYYKFKRFSYYINNEDCEENGDINTDLIYSDFDGELRVVINSIFEDKDGQECDAIFFEILLKPRSISLYLERGEILFDDRRSAVRYKREILSSLFDFVNISDIFILLNTDVEIYKRLISEVENVNINNLYLDDDDRVRNLCIFTGNIRNGKLDKKI